MRNVATVLLCAIAAACAQRETPAGPRARPADVSRAKVSEVIQPAPQFVDHSLLGAQLGPDGMVSKETDSFTPGEPIYLILVLRESPPGLQTSAVWSNAEKKQLRVERKQMNGTKVATFSFRDPKMKPGHYRVVGYWGGNIAAEREFNVVARQKATRKKG